MRDLAGIQKEFLDRILTGDDQSGHSSPSAGSSQSEEFSAGIYRNLVAANHLHALKDVYPVCCRLVGEKYFSFLAWNYLTEKPTNDPDLNRYGDDFASFLEHEVRVRNELDGLGYLPEFSQFEWAMHSASRAGEAFLPLEDILSRLLNLGDKDAVLFHLNPSLSLMKFSYPVIRIWKENQLEEVGEIRLDRVSEQVAVWNNRGDVLYQLLDDDIFSLLMLIRQGSPFDELNNIYRDQEQRLEQLISLSIGNRWIIDVEELVI